MNLQDLRGISGIAVDHVTVRPMSNWQRLGIVCQAGNDPRRPIGYLVSQ
jgi:hypothetical protein